jgi:dienelactone hydrolase
MHRNVSTADSRYVFFVSISALAIYSQAWPLRGAEHQTAPAKKAPQAPVETAQLPPLDRLGDEAFAAIRELYVYDSTTPLEARVVEKKEMKDDPGGDREKIVLRTTQGCLVPGYLQLPKNGPGPAPCVLLLHGWSGSKENWFTDGNYISGGQTRKSLLAAGFAVLALDAQCHGDRIASNDFAPVNHFIDKDAGNPRKGYFTLREIYTQTVVDYRRAVDYLETRREIDATRIGVLGYSMGGTQTFMLTAVEPRIRVAVACAVPADTKKLSLVAPQNYARGIGERPFLMVMGQNDPLCGVEHARQLYALVESRSTAIEFFGGHHKLTPDFVPRAVEWMVKNLK